MQVWGNGVLLLWGCFFIFRTFQLPPLPHATHLPLSLLFHLLTDPRHTRVGAGARGQASLLPRGPPHLWAHRTAAQWGWQPRHLSHGECRGEGGKARGPQWQRTGASVQGSVGGRCLPRPPSASSSIHPPYPSEWGEHHPPPPLRVCARRCLRSTCCPGCWPAVVRDPLVRGSLEGGKIWMRCRGGYI